MVEGFQSHESFWERLGSCLPGIEEFIEGRQGISPREEFGLEAVEYDVKGDFPVLQGEVDTVGNYGGGLEEARPEEVLSAPKRPVVDPT